MKRFFFCLFIFAFCLSSACSLPILESGACSEARDSVKEFYSWYLGTDSQTRAANPDMYRKHVAPMFVPDQKNPAGSDPFFISNEPPTTFKVGTCKPVDDTHCELQVQLYWRTDNKTEQKEVQVKTVKAGDKEWIISRVYN